MFVVVYRPPYLDVDPVPITVFLTEFSDYLENIVLCSETLVISGDFNLHMNYSTDPGARRFCELLETFGLEQNFMFASNTSGHWLDLIINGSPNDVMVLSPPLAVPIGIYFLSCFIECSLAILSTVVTVKEVSFSKWREINLWAFKEIHSDEGLTLETSVFESFTVANLPNRPCGV